MEYLSDRGAIIYKRIEAHCKDKLKMFDIDSLELTMLANSFDVYARAAKICNDEGFSNKHNQIRAEYTVMKTEYQNILKHSAKFGLNPGDRDKIFKGLKDNKDDKKKKGFNLKV